MGVGVKLVIDLSEKVFHLDDMMYVIRYMILLVL